MELIALIILFWVPPFLIIIRRLFWDLYFWQIKEYRWDRFWTHIRWDQDDLRRDYVSIALKFILFSSITFLFSAPEIALVGILFSYIYWVFESFDLIKDLLLRKIVRPNLRNVRNILIIVMFLALLTCLITLLALPFLSLTRAELIDSNLGYFSQALTSKDTTSQLIPDIFILFGFYTALGLIIDIAMPILVPIFVALTAPLSWLRRNLFIRKGIKHYAKFKNNLTFIGITGSQGKTTTKELLANVLSQEFKVAKTEENMNTKFGLSFSILKNIKKSTQIFIGEIGAYKKNEIKNVVKDYSPEISIITDIDTQHVGLFGSRQDLAEAKAEIISDNTRVAILNGDNDYCVKLSKSISDKKIYLFTTAYPNSELLKRIDTNPNVVLVSLKKHTRSKDFSLLELDVNGVIYELKTALLSKDYLIDVLMIIIAVGLELGIEKNNLIKAISALEFKTPRLNIETGDNDTKIINDTYSSSRKGFIAAVELLDNEAAKVKSKRIVVTKGIYELGSEKEAVYSQLAKDLANKIDYLITTDNLLKKQFDKYKEVHAIKVKDFEEMIYSVRKISEPSDVILLEGRLNPKVIKTLVSDNF